MRFWLLGCLAVLLPATALSQATLTMVISNGPAANRLNIVVLSEGYTSNQLGQFLVDATNAINGLLSIQPYQEYQSYFNAYAISVPSNQSGSDHPNSAIYRDTYFNSTYDSVNDFLITIPPNFADTNYSHGQGKVDALLSTWMPNCQLPVLLVNDVTPGGSDGFDRAAISYNGFDDANFVAHESGHVLANLGDEYTTPRPGFPNTEEPNTTQQTNRSLIKWRTWISTNTPVPTPTNSQTMTAVGLFRGAHYHPSGWYRPKLTCAMNSRGAPFCEVCSEQLALSIYKHVRPVDGFSPASTGLFISSTQAVSFNLSVLQPSTHSLMVQWLTNGVTVSGETNFSLTLPAFSLSAGTHSVSARVHDGTSLVRNDTLNLLGQSVTWRLYVNISPPQDSALEIYFRRVGHTDIFLPWLRRSSH